MKKEQLQKMKKGVYTDMKIESISYFIVDSIKSLKRNKTLSTISIITVSASIFIFGVFLLMMLNVKQGINQVQSKAEIKVILQDNIKPEDKSQLEKKARSTKGVVDVIYESKEAALNQLKNQLGSKNSGLLEGVEKNNPLPNSFILRVDKLEDISRIADNIKSEKGIEQIKDQKQIINKLIVMLNVVEWVGIVLFLILVTISIILIGNTIKLTVYSRRREIGIMKLIGATNWFVRIPFLIEGMIIGLTGSLISLSILYLGYKYIYMKALTSLFIIQVVSPTYILSNLLWIFTLAGIIVGIIGSSLSLRKFLFV